jgi:hypothetical protein
MRQHKVYFFVIAVIFFGQCAFTSAFVLGMEEVPEPIKKHSVGEHRVEPTREVASIPEVKPLDLSDFYFLQIDRYKAEKNKDAALSVILKLQASTTNKELIARSEYERINLICNQRLEADCLGQIDTMVTHYPNSNWTARSLLLLSHYYFTQNRTAEAKSLIQIIKTEFKAYNDFAYDIKKLNSKSL